MIFNKIHWPGVGLSSPPGILYLHVLGAPPVTTNAGGDDQRDVRMMTRRLNDGIVMLRLFHPPYDRQTTPYPHAKSRGVICPENF